MAFMDYMDLDVGCPKKAVKLNQSLTNTKNMFFCVCFLFF